MTPLEAMQTTLAAEHAAVYVYGVVGGRVSASQEPELWRLVEDAYTVHRDRRDRLIGMVRAEEGDPVAAEVSYELPSGAGPFDLEQVALTVEQRSMSVYADMVGSTWGGGRHWALEALEDAAVRSLGFGGEPEPFPGVGEL
jgi:hypothetical protein